MKIKIFLSFFILVIFFSNCQKKSSNNNAPTSSSSTSGASTTGSSTTGGTLTPTTADLTFIVKYKCPGTSSFQTASAKVVKIYDGLANFNSNNVYYYQTTSGTGITTFTGLPLRTFYYSVGWSGSCGGTGGYYFSKTGSINLPTATGYTVNLNVI